LRGLWTGGRVQGHHSWPHPLICTGRPPQVRDACRAAIVLQHLLALVCSTKMLVLVPLVGEYVSSGLALRTIWYARSQARHTALTSRSDVSICPSAVLLTLVHLCFPRFVTKKPMLVCGNTASMVEETWLVGLCGQANVLMLLLRQECSIFNKILLLRYFGHDTN